MKQNNFEKERSKRRTKVKQILKILSGYDIWTIELILKGAKREIELNTIYNIRKQKKVGNLLEK